MKFNTYRLNKLREEVNLNELDINSFDMIGTTGDGLALRYKDERMIFLKTKVVFDIYLAEQRHNDIAVKNKIFHYLHGENGKNKKDSKGKCIHIYTKPIDCYAQFKINEVDFISDETFDKICEKAQEMNIFAEWVDGVFYQNTSCDKFII